MAYLYSGIIIANTPKFIRVFFSFFFRTSRQRQRHVSVLMSHPLKPKLESMGEALRAERKPYMSRFLGEERRK